MKDNKKNMMLLKIKLRHKDTCEGCPYLCLGIKCGYYNKEDVEYFKIDITNWSIKKVIEHLKSYKAKRLPECVEQNMIIEN